jgi:hypothetical protein
VVPFKPAATLSFLASVKPTGIPLPSTTAGGLLATAFKTRFQAHAVVLLASLMVVHEWGALHSAGVSVELEFQV